jgi:gluconolactonase
MSWEFIKLAGPFGFTEGPAWDGSGVIFSDIPNSRILRYDEASGETSVFRTGTNGANGLMLDSQGRLYACEGDTRRMVRYNSDGSCDVLADRFEGKRLNSPNDLAFDAQGRP